MKKNLINSQSAIIEALKGMLTEIIFALLVLVLGGAISFLVTGIIGQ
jgi:hypothetical protein